MNDRTERLPQRLLPHVERRRHASRIRNVCAVLAVLCAVAVLPGCRSGAPEHAPTEVAAEAPAPEIAAETPLPASESPVPAGDTPAGDGIAPAAADAEPTPGSVVQVVPEEFRKDVERALGEAGDNRHELVSCFEQLAGDERDGWAFLVANMSTKDLQTISADLLTEHIHYAYVARTEFPWTKGLSRDIFYHYVLPIRSSQEPLEAWRRFFFEEMQPILAGMQNPTLEEVALAVNRYCGSKVTFKPTPADDQSPLQTHEKGFGRCEEEMIYFNAVARSAGIPSRSVSTPYWPFQDNNHAWCEVYTGEDTREGAQGWHYLGACEPADNLNKAWFTRVVERAALVTCAIMGTPDGENILTMRDRFAVINTTAVYAETCRLTIRVKDAQGAPVPEAAVFTSVFNFGTLRPILGVRSDEQGTFALDIGVGDYLITARNGKEWGWAIARSTPGTDAACSITIGGEPPGGAYWLRYPRPGTQYPVVDAPVPDVPVVEPHSETKDDPILTLKFTSTESGSPLPIVVAIAPIDTIPWRIAQGNAWKVTGNDSIPIGKPGRYVVMAGRRNPNGDVHLYLNTIMLERGKRTTITLEGDLSLDEGGALPIARELDDLPEVTLATPNGERRSVRDLIGEKGLLLAFFSLEHEPSQRMLPTLKALSGDAQRTGCNVVGVHVPGAAVPDLAGRAAAKGMDLPVLLADGGETPWATSFHLPTDEKSGEYSDLPAVIVLDKDGNVVLWHEGYDLNIEAKVRAALARISK